MHFLNKMVNRIILLLIQQIKQQYNFKKNINLILKQNKILKQKNIVNLNNQFRMKTVQFVQKHSKQITYVDN